MARGQGMKDTPMLILFCAFCRGDRGEPVYGDSFSKHGLCWSRSSNKSGVETSKIPSNLKINYTESKNRRRG
jgi:hypothetical protein